MVGDPNITGCATTEPPKKTESKPRVYLAVDPGAGNVKIRGKWNDRKAATNFSQPSVIAYVDERQVLTGENVVAKDVFQCVASDNELVFGKTWVTGRSVALRSLTADNPSHDANLKISNALPLVLSALINGQIVQPGETEVVLVATHHNPVDMGKELIAQLSGQHWVKKAGEVYKILIHLPERGVFAEGAFIDSGAEEFVTVDMGYLTTLVCKRLGSTESTVKSIPTPVGVGALVEMIAAHSLATKQIGGVHLNADAVAEALKVACLNQDIAQMVYRHNGRSFPLEDAYKDALTAWFKSALMPAIRLINECKGSGIPVWAIGGGVNLPLVKERLIGAGFAVWEGDPIFANVESLYGAEVAKLLRHGNELKLPAWKKPKNQKVEPKSTSKKSVSQNAQN